MIHWLTSTCVTRHLPAAHFLFFFQSKFIFLHFPVLYPFQIFLSVSPLSFSVNFGIGGTTLHTERQEIFVLTNISLELQSLGIRIKNQLPALSRARVGSLLFSGGFQECVSVRPNQVSLALTTERFHQVDSKVILSNLEQFFCHFILYCSLFRQK